MGFAIGAGGVLLLLALISAYLLLAPVKFTDSDIISVTLQSQGTQNAPQTDSSTPKPSQPATPQSNQNAPQPSAQQNRPNTASPSTQKPQAQSPQAAPASQNNASRNSPSPQRMAVDTLTSFHSYITQHEYRKAYNCLSPDYQGQVSYEGWAPGFKTTVSSTPSRINVVSATKDKVVLTYILTAVDNPGGTQEFNGTVTVIKTNEGWKIDDIENKSR